MVCLSLDNHGYHCLLLSPGEGGRGTACSSFSSLVSSLTILCFRTVLLDRDNKDKKNANLPKSQIVRKPHSSLPSSGRDRTLNSAIPGPSQSSYSGLGPGRGASSARPHSPGQRAVPRPLPTSNSSPSQYQTSRPASQPSQATDHQHRSQAKYPSALKSNPSKPMNTEIMKKTLRSANATGIIKRASFMSTQCY